MTLAETLSRAKHNRNITCYVQEIENLARGNTDGVNTNISANLYHRRMVNLEIRGEE